MTEKDISIYFENVKVWREKTYYVIALELEGETFYIDEEQVEDIANKTKQDEDLTAIVLAYIEYARKSRNSDKDDKVKSLEDDVLFFGLSKLLDKYSGEELIEIIRELKWHEICQVLNSEKPISEIEEFI